MKYNIKDFSIDEKIRLITGKNEWETDDLGGKVPSVFMADGPHGLNKFENGKFLPATAMPSLCVLANTWDVDLAEEMGSAIADECIENNVDVLLAPGVNIKRDILNGRNFEYFSEDPYLTGKFARRYIEGVQKKGIGTSLKHFCANNFEYDRYTRSSEIDERTLREIYFPAFEEALKAKPWTVMSSYNRLNGVYTAQHKKLLKNVLRDEFGFEGLTVSDWSAVHDHVAAVKATLGLRMPYKDCAFEELKEAYNKGVLTEEEIDVSVNQVLELIQKKIDNNDKKVFTTEKERHDIAVKIAKEGIVLLKNQDNILPLKGNENLAVLGWFDKNPAVGGGGSSAVVVKNKIPALSEILAQKFSGRVYSGMVVTDEFLRTVEREEANLNEAYISDVVLVCVGETSAMVLEGRDKETIRLTAAQENLILKTAKYNSNVVVLISGSSVVDMSAWIDKVKAVMYVGFAGEGVNEALSSLILGEDSPCGKLTETFPVRIEDTVTEGKLCSSQVEHYKEGIFVGYRHYDYEQLDVLFPFGHGLSYADFEYSDLTAVVLDNGSVEVSYCVENKSSKAAKEVSQVYVKDVFSSVVRPIRELKGFSKDYISPNEKKKISVILDTRAFAYFSTATDEWTIEKGVFEIEVGVSSRDIKLSTKISL